MSRFTIEKGHIVEIDAPPVKEAKPKKKRVEGINDPITREFYFKYFITEFYKVFGYKYGGDRYKDCSSIYGFLNHTQYDVDFLKEMVEYVLYDHHGYWEGKPLSINLLCYGRTHYDIIDAVQKRKQMVEAPDLGNFLEDSI